MTEAAQIAQVTHDLAGVFHDAQPAEWTAEDRDLVLGALSTVAYEMPGLSARIRAAKVNDTPVPHPVKPGPKPVEPPPPPPPPPPPTEDRHG